MKNLGIKKLLLSMFEHGTSWPVNVVTEQRSQVQLCIAAWSVYNGFAPSTVRGYWKSMGQGVKSFSARKVIKGMNKKAVGGSREKASMVVNWLQQQVNNKVGMGADLMPTSDGAKHLPIRNKKEGYAQLREAFGKNDSAVPSYSYFNKVWRSEDEVHNIKTQRKVGTLERCGVCRKLDMEVESAKAEDNIKLAEL